jgi:opacity protein-like surface antigen
MLTKREVFDEHDRQEGLNEMKRALFVGLALLLIATGSFAGTKEGQSEIQVQGSLQNVSYADNDQTELTIQLVYNRFMRDDLSLGCTFRPSLSKSDDTENQQLFLLGRGDYYFTPQTKYVPYAGAHLGLINYTFDSGDSSSSETAFTYGLQGGWKFFISENMSWNLELDLSLYSAEDEDITVTSLLAGMSYYF